MGKLKKFLMGGEVDDKREMEYYEDYFSTVEEAKKRYLERIDLDPSNRSWEYDGHGTPRNKKTGTVVTEIDLIFETLERIETKLDMVMEKVNSSSS